MSEIKRFDWDCCRSGCEFNPCEEPDGEWVRGVDHDAKVTEIAQEIERLTAELGDGTTGKKYRAELYDEIWQKSRDMGYLNVTTALAELEQVKKAQTDHSAQDLDMAPQGEPIAWLIQAIGATYLVERKAVMLEEPTESDAIDLWNDAKWLCIAIQPLYAAPPPIPTSQVLVERELLERVERYFSGFVSDEPPAYALGSNGLATIRAILSRKGGDV